MKLVQREEILDYVTYNEQRKTIRDAVLKIKELRRVHLGEHLTFLFENRDTIRYQIQEMMRTEKIVKEVDILHEMETYNDLLGGKGELGCTLMIEIDSSEERDIKLKKWLRLPYHLYAILDDRTRIPASFDERQIGTDKLSSVQYIKFNTGGQIPISLECDHANFSLVTKLTPEQMAALSKDLSSDS